MTAPVEELLPNARALAEATGKLPSVRSLRSTLRVGQPKAQQLRARLVSEVLQATSRRGRIQAGSAVPERPNRRMVRRTIPVSGVPVSPGMPALDPWDYALPTSYPEPPRPPMSAPAVPAPVPPPAKPARKLATWPVLIVAAGAFVAIWAGWVALGKLTGFGKVNLLPGFWSGWTVDTAITLPLGMEAYAAYAFYVWLHPASPHRARTFAAWSSLGAVVLGMGGQTAYHLMNAAGMTAAPWQITTVVSCLPVAVFGMAAALVHLVRAGDEQ